MTVVADTGALYALVDASDAWHSRVVAWWERHGADVVIPSVTLAEVTYLLQTRIGPAAEHAFVESLAEGELALDEFDPADLPRAAELMHRYADFPLGFVDAAVVAAAERLETREILTTDRRHFGAVRPRHARTLTLLP